MFWGIRLTGKHAIVTTVEILPTGTNLQIFHLSRSEQAAQLRIVEDLQGFELPLKDMARFAEVAERACTPRVASTLLNTTLRL